MRRLFSRKTTLSAPVRRVIVENLECRRLLAVSTPFGGTPAAVPGTIQFENFDNGGENVAYHDTTPANEGGQYRNEAVDLSTASDAGAGYFVGWTNPGEWENYTVNVASNGAYSVSLRVA